jgi:integrase
VCDITSKDIIQWQNEMMDYRDKNGKGFSATYLKTLHNQISAILNHAVRFYELKSNPALKAGSVGKKEATEMLFWTKEEYLKFADSMRDKPLSFYAFEVLYWCGVRLGEMLALTPADFDFVKNTVSVTKSYQRFNGRDVITDPKTPKSNCLWK